MPRLAGFRTSIESAFTIRPRGRERLPCQAGVLFVTLVNNSSECNNRSHADLMHNNRSARRRFGEPPPCHGWRKSYLQRSRESSDSDRTRETLTFVNERTCCGYAIVRLSLKRKIIATAAVTSARTRAAISRHFHWRRACVAQRDTWCAHPLV